MGIESSSDDKARISEMLVEASLLHPKHETLVMFRAQAALLDGRAGESMVIVSAFAEKCDASDCFPLLLRALIILQSAGLVMTNLQTEEDRVYMMQSMQVLLLLYTYPCRTPPPLITVRGTHAS